RHLRRWPADRVRGDRRWSAAPLDSFIELDLGETAARHRWRSISILGAEWSIDRVLCRRRKAEAHRYRRRRRASARERSTAMGWRVEQRRHYPFRSAYRIAASRSSPGGQPAVVTKREPQQSNHSYPHF